MYGLQVPISNGTANNSLCQARDRLLISPDLGTCAELVETYRGRDSNSHVLLGTRDFKSRVTPSPSPNKHSTLGNRGKSDTEIIRRFREEQHIPGAEPPSKLGPEEAEK